MQFWGITFLVQLETGCYVIFPKLQRRLAFVKVFRFCCWSKMFSIADFFLGLGYFWENVASNEIIVKLQHLTDRVFLLYDIRRWSLRSSCIWTRFVTSLFSIYWWMSIFFEPKYIKVSRTLSRATLHCCYIFSGKQLWKIIAVLVFLSINGARNVQWGC